MRWKLWIFLALLLSVGEGVREWQQYRRWHARHQVCLDFVATHINTPVYTVDPEAWCQP